MAHRVRPAGRGRRAVWLWGGATGGHPQAGAPPVELVRGRLPRPARRLPFPCRSRRRAGPLSGRVLGKQMRRVPRHHTVWSIESLDAGRMVIRTAANARDMREGFARWHADNKVAYRKWLEKHDSGGP